MIMTPVVSSNIDSVGYENNRLYVKFKSGATYAYKNVPANIFEDLQKASSKGKYIIENVKPKYQYEKLVLNESAK